LVTEALSEEEVDVVSAQADLIQIGTRNMQNFALLKRVGQSGKPVLLKRGLCATIDEWLLAGEYLMKHGAEAVVFCERGLRHYDPSTRNLLDLGAAALMKYQYGLPVVVDPSHAAGRRDLIAPLSRAAIAMGVDGLMIETHPDPGLAKSDAAQALSSEELKELSASLGVRQARAPYQGAETALPFNPNTAEPLSAQRSLS
jgi:3-deoxy-7-phosphoheptulonate synthase